MAYGT